jgi:hypothetical protein
VNVQLIAAETGTHVWAEQFDKPVADLFDMKDEIVSRLANTLNAQLIAAEARRAENTPYPDAMDLYFLVRASLNKGATQGAAGVRLFGGPGGSQFFQGRRADGAVGQLSLATPTLFCETKTCRENP